MPTYVISYILTTYNKLPYLQHVLSRLIAARQPDEEIVVCDGGSSDGTAAYLQGLFEQGQIQQFVSERDKGEAHGFNKGMLMARGEVVKIITDDDAFYYPAIRQSAAFMMNNKDVDVVLGYNALLRMEDLSSVLVLEDQLQQYKQWLKTGDPFWMVALPMLIRRSSLSLTGLFYAAVVLVDVEFIYRITKLKVNIAWCNQVISTHISNSESNSNRMTDEARNKELLRAKAFYDFVNTRSSAKKRLSEYSNNIMEALKRPIRPVKRALFDKFGLDQIPAVSEKFNTGDDTVANTLSNDPLSAAYKVCDDFMATHNASKTTEFIYQPQSVKKALAQ